MKRALEVELVTCYIHEMDMICVEAHLGGWRLFQTAPERVQDGDVQEQERRHQDRAFEEVTLRLGQALIKHRGSDPIGTERVKR